MSRRECEAVDVVTLDGLARHGLPLLTHIDPDQRLPDALVSGVRPTGRCNPRDDANGWGLRCRCRCGRAPRRHESCQRRRNDAGGGTSVGEQSAHPRKPRAGLRRRCVTTPGAYLFHTTGQVGAVVALAVTKEQNRYGPRTCPLDHPIPPSPAGRSRRCLPQPSGPPCVG